MKIWHVGASSNPLRVDGVSRTVWLLSREQAKLGHDVSLLVDSAPDANAIQMAREVGLTLVHVEANPATYAREIKKLLRAGRPEIVHMHSVFVLRQSTLGKVLARFGVPYVITPHGGLAPQVLRRGVIKKSIYAWLRERPRFMGAAAVALVTPAEERAVRSFIPEYQGIVRWMPNPIELADLSGHAWKGMGQERRVVFLGRFDVLVKGIDILIEIARLLPDVRFDLYGTEDAKTLEWLNRLRQHLPGNVEFHDPIFGRDKAAMLSQASLYLQPSRWEGFPVSVAECLFIGVPSAIADTLDLAQLFYQHHLGLVIPLDPKRAAAQIDSALRDESRMRDLSDRGRQFAVEHFHPVAVAGNHVKLYEEVVQIHARPTRFDDAETVTIEGLNGHDVPVERPSRRKTSVKHRLIPPRVRSSIKSSLSQMVERSAELAGRTAHPRTVVLCYHSINKQHIDLAVDPDAFREQMWMLRDMGYGFLSFGELVHHIMGWGTPPGNVACITFDDGYEDNLTHAAPILAEMGVPATVFVTTGLMAGETEIVDHFTRLTRYKANYLTAPQVAQLHRMGIEIGAHTHSHPNLARISVDHARRELTRSKALLESTIGTRVRSLAYPFGKRGIHYTPETVQVARESGYCGAAAVAFRAVTARKGTRIYEVPRFFVTRADTHASFRQKISGHFDWLGSAQESAPTWLKATVSPEDRY